MLSLNLSSAFTGTGSAWCSLYQPGTPNTNTSEDTPYANKVLFVNFYVCDLEHKQLKAVTEVNYVQQQYHGQCQRQQAVVGCSTHPKGCGQNLRP